MAELSQNAFNERLKLTATFLNNIGVALLAAGVFVPAIGLVSDRPPIAAGQFLAIGTGCGVFAAVLHVLARGVLRNTL